jgi:hypothetical protein
LYFPIRRKDDDLYFQSGRQVLQGFELRVDDQKTSCYTFVRQLDMARGNAGVVQLVECLLAKEKVVGSSPIARSSF